MERTNKIHNTHHSDKSEGESPSVDYTTAVAWFTCSHFSHEYRMSHVWYSVGLSGLLNCILAFEQA